MNDYAISEGGEPNTLSTTLIAVCADYPKNHGAYVRCVKGVIYALDGASCNKAGDITACADGCRYDSNEVQDRLLLATIVARD